MRDICKYVLEPLSANFEIKPIMLYNLVLRYDDILIRNIIFLLLFRPLCN